MPDQDGYCQACGRWARVKNVRFMQNIGALIMRFSKEINGRLCKHCINSYYWKFTGITAVAGWWGIISLIITPFILIINTVYFLGSLGMQAEPSAPPQHF